MTLISVFSLLVCHACKPKNKAIHYSCVKTNAVTRRSD